jgi:hypothetical protein
VSTWEDWKYFEDQWRDGIIIKKSRVRGRGQALDSINTTWLRIIYVWTNV